MFTKKITNSDDFISMPGSSQNLYFHLNMEADDEGFVNSPKRIMRSINASEDDLRILLMKRFVLGFESGVIVIKHWKMHNKLRQDRIKLTDYQKERDLLIVKENESYTEKEGVSIGLLEDMPTDVRQVSDKCPPSIDQCSVVEISVVEGSKEKKRTKTSRFAPPSIEELNSYISENNYNVNSDTFMNHYETVGWKVGKNKMEDWKAAVRGWHSRQKGNTKAMVSKQQDVPDYMKTRKGKLVYEEVD